MRHQVSKVYAVHRSGGKSPDRKKRKKFSTTYEKRLSRPERTKKNKLTQTPSWRLIKKDLLRLKSA